MPPGRSRSRDRVSSRGGGRNNSRDRSRSDSGGREREWDDSIYSNPPAPRDYSSSNRSNQGGSNDKFSTNSNSAQSSSRNRANNDGDSSRRREGSRDDRWGSRRDSPTQSRFSSGTHGHGFSQNDSIPPVGRGRGRELTIPAWMKQKQDAGIGPENHSHAPPQQSSYYNAPNSQSSDSRVPPYAIPDRGTRGHSRDGNRGRGRNSDQQQFDRGDPPSRNQEYQSHDRRGPPSKYNNNFRGNQGQPPMSNTPNNGTSNRGDMNTFYASDNDNMSGVSRSPQPQNLGRGRGRMNTLPAWMSRQQQENASNSSNFLNGPNVNNSDPNFAAPVLNGGGYAENQNFIAQPPMQPNFNVPPPGSIQYPCEPNKSLPQALPPHLFHPQSGATFPPLQVSGPTVNRPPQHFPPSQQPLGQHQYQMGQTTSKQPVEVLSPQFQYPPQNAPRQQPFQTEPAPYSEAPRQDTQPQIHSAQKSNATRPTPRVVDTNEHLPSNWKAVNDPATNSVYYWNITSNEVKWEKPTH